MVRKLLDGLYLAAGYLAGAFLIAIFVMMMAMSIGREIGLNVKSGDDITAWCMASSAFLGLAHTFKAGGMIRVELIAEKLTGWSKYLAETFSLAMAALFVGFFAWQVVLMTYTSWLINDTSTGVLVVPLWIPQSGFAAGLVILFIAVADELVWVATCHKPRYQKDAPSTAVEVEQAAASAI
ncbi:MAG: TRAP transporter small permease [Proteobacteria bacterium]|nr:TRAP transporter small permease [Pseudomonadota bacterium]